MAERDIIARLVVEGANQFVTETQKAAKAEEQLNTAIKQNTTEQEKNVKTTTSARAELRQLREELIQLARQGKVNTQEYNNLKNKAGELADAIGDASDEIRQAGSDTRGLDKALRAATVLTGAFTAVQGVTAVFGKENEKLQQSLLKVQGALSVLNGLQAVQAELTRKDSIFTEALAKAKLAYTAAIGAATGATKAFRLALIATGIGAAVVAISLLVANWDKLTGAIARAFPGLAKFGEKVSGIIQSVTDFIGITSAADRAITAQVKALEAQNRELERQAKVQDSLGKSVESAKIRVQIAKNTVELLKLQGKSEEDVKDAINDVTIAQNQLANAVRKANDEQENKNKTDAEQLGLLGQLKKELDEVNKKIELIDTNTSVDTVTALFGEQADLESRIAGFEKIFSNYQKLSKIQLINHQNLNSIKEVEDAINLVNSAIVTLDKDAPQQQGLKKLLADLTQQLNLLKPAAENIKDLFADPLIPKGSLDLKRDISKSIGELQRFGFERSRLLKKRLEEERFSAEETKQIQESIKQQQIQNVQDVSGIVSQGFDFYRSIQNAQLAILENRLKQGLISEEQYQKEVAEINRKQAISDKLKALFDIAIQTAVAVVSALKTSPILAGIVGALGAAQAAVVAATPIPKFFKGVKDFAGGLAWVGDGGKREPITDRSGNVLGVSPAKPTLVNLPEGSNVYKDIPTFKKETGIHTLPTHSLDRIRPTDEARYLKAIEREISEGNQQILHLLRQGNVNTRQSVNVLKEMKQTRRAHYV